jgi:hypothetical protein
MMARSPTKTDNLGTPRHEVGSLEPDEIFDVGPAGAPDFPDDGSKDAARPVVQFKLRLEKAEHAWLAEQAKKAGRTINGEARARIRSTKGQEALLTVDQLVENASRYLRPMIAAAEDRERYADLIDSVIRLTELIRPFLATHAIDGEPADEIRAVIREIHVAITFLEMAAGKKIIRESRKS